MGHPSGGVRRHVLEIIKHSRDHIESGLVCGSNGDKIFNDEILTFKAPLLTLNITKSFSFSDFTNIVKICRFIQKNEFEIVHGHGAKAGLYARICATFTRVKSVYSPHGGILHDMFGKVSDMLYRQVEFLLSFMTDFIIFESKYSKNAYIRKISSKLGSKSRIIYYGIEPTAPQDQFHKYEVADINFGIFANLRFIKGQHIALKAWSLNTNKNLNLHLFGAGDDEAYFKEICLEHNLSNKVYFHGETDDPVEEMRRMDYIIVPSNFEAFGYVPLEASLENKIVISSDAGGLLESAGPYSIIFKKGDANDLSKKIDQAISLSPAEREDRLRRNHERTLEKFSMEKMIRNLLNVYISLV